MIVSWKAVTHSAIGTRHIAREMPCQDFGDFQIRDGLVFAAVSDGAGSAKFSDLGARLAVQTWIETAMGKLDSMDFSSSTIAEFDFRPLFEEITSEVLERLTRESESGEYPLRELGCTLLSFIASADWIAAMQIGDGFIVYQAVDSDDYELVFRPDKGEFINETLFVTSRGAIESLQYSFQTCSPRFICAATDGLEKVAISYQDWTPHRPFFKPFKDCLQLIPEPSEQYQYLQTFLESERLNARTDDDKTLLLCLADREGVDQESAEHQMSAEHEGAEREGIA
ncbi:MAG: PP2C family serine/threonine-protein phosphatase [Cyanobacteria bacterium P01_F01_bin.42]